MPDGKVCYKRKFDKGSACAYSASAYGALKISLNIIQKALKNRVMGTHENENGIIPVVLLPLENDFMIEYTTRRNTYVLAL